MSNIKLIKKDDSESKLKRKEAIEQIQNDDVDFLLIAVDRKSDDVLHVGCGLSRPEIIAQLEAVKFDIFMEAFEARLC